MNVILLLKFHIRIEKNERMKARKKGVQIRKKESKKKEHKINKTNKISTKQTKFLSRMYGKCSLYA